LKRIFTHLAPFRLPANFGLFIVFSWLHMLAVTWVFYRSGNPEFGWNHHSAFHLAVWLTYSLVYLLPGILLALLACMPRIARPGMVAFFAVVGTSLCILLIRTDSVIYDLYRFHFNGFVLNLLLTPGGVESLGGGSDTYASIALLALAHVSVQTIGWFLCAWLVRKNRLAIRWAWVVGIIAIVMLGERIAYAVADLRNDGPILEAVRTYPLYGRTKFRTLAAKFGIKTQHRQMQMAVSSAQGRLNYPLEQMNYSPVTQPPNVMILVAESLRWDRLTEKTMPNTWRFAQKGLHFTRHYSSGNGTREALFGMFYGLYGSYWSSFLYAQRSPLLMDRFQELGYQFDLRTSARFSYPEFDRTLFAKIPADQLHESKSGKAPWEVDRENTDALLDFLKKRDPARPFMSFFFIESTHARYTFPDSAAIAEPYLENVNYAAMTRESLIPKIDQLLNRYTNSAHWVDVQMGRIYAALEEQGLLENTIVIFTGDHGEEFMEKGAWGHNSSFVDEQIRTPMVMWMPGTAPQVIEAVSSHLDIGTTLLQLLGAPNDPSGYSLGRNLLDLAERPYVVSSDWHSISVITDDMKYRIPYANRGADNWSPTDVSDNPYAKDAATAILQKNNQLILEAIKNSSKFISTNKRQ
jgi:membrane-anchored protein YejM (alkaline phosphatase superfamily)